MVSEHGNSALASIVSLLSAVFGLATLPGYG